jgi:GNAT superfamily N-acetyltransferase
MIEKLKHKDVVECAKLYNKCLKMQKPPGKAILKETLIELNKLDCFVFKENSKILGLITFAEKSNAINIDFICSLHKRKGIATKLLNKIKIGNKKIIATVSDEDKRAKAFYDKNGFKKYSKFKDKFGLLLYKIKYDNN